MKKIFGLMAVLALVFASFGSAAAQDILDRGGHRPVDVVEHINKMDGELRIVHITKDEKAINNIVEAEFEEIK